ncbi:MAG: MutS-related protein [Anaerolineae bacterium]
MRVHLMSVDQDFDPHQPLPTNASALMEDLELEMLLTTMAAGDRFLYDVAKTALLSSLTEPDAIRYRQDILRDCLNHPSVVRDIYGLTVESVETKKRQWLGVFSRYPSAILQNAIRLLKMLVGLLARLRHIADQRADTLQSEGFLTFFEMIRTELDDEFFARVQEHLDELRFRDGVLLSMELGRGNEDIHHVLRKPRGPRHSRVGELIEMISAFGRVINRGRSGYTFWIHPRDQAGARTLGELKDTGVNLVANALAQSADHIESFLKTLRVELAFYVACLNLHERLTELDEPVTFSEPLRCDERAFSCVGLYDVCLALTMGRQIVGNDVQADHKNLVIITGANQGGKSTFLRSTGLAQLMMQCGMFVAAKSFRANVCEGLFTHYRREEDAAMESGKLDEELARMSRIADSVAANSLLLFNESFAATNEREGSEIAYQIISALLDGRVKVFFVTHLYGLAHRFHSEGSNGTIFLRAERRLDGTRTFRMVEAEPQHTSYGQDLYWDVFSEGRHFG